MRKEVRLLLLGKNFRHFVNTHIIKVSTKPTHQTQTNAPCFFAEQRESNFLPSFFFLNSHSLIFARVCVCVSACNAQKVVLLPLVCATRRFKKELFNNIVVVVVVVVVIDVLRAALLLRSGKNTTATNSSSSDDDGRGEAALDEFNDNSIDDDDDDEEEISLLFDQQQQCFERKKKKNDTREANFIQLSLFLVFFSFARAR